MQEQKVYKNMKEAVNEMFFRQVLGLPKALKIKKNTTLASFCQNKKFETEYVEMLSDKMERVFNVSIKKIKDKPLVEILLFVEQRKIRASSFRF